MSLVVLRSRQKLVGVLSMNACMHDLRLDASQLVTQSTVLVTAIFQ